MEYKRLTKRIGDEVHTMAWDGGIIHRLAELEDKIEDGTTLLLPCKIGDPIYMIVTKRWERYLNTHSFILKTKLTYYNIPRVLSRFGKTIFLTKGDLFE